MSQVTDLVIHCPPMAVRNTSWWNPFAARLTDYLTCLGELTLPDGHRANFRINFPPCYVRRVAAGRWLVDAVRASGQIEMVARRLLYIDFPAEPVLRDGSNMVAQPVDSVGGLLTGMSWGDARLKATLPMAVGRPVGFGMRTYVVDAVEVHGTAEWVGLGGG